MTIQTTNDELRTLLKHAEGGYPYEVVGILAGNKETMTLSKVAPLINERSDSAHNRYKVSGLTLMKAERELESKGYDILGYYHSHPDHSAEYSDYDRDHALPNLAYLIVSVHNGESGDIAVWRLKEDRSAMFRESLTIQK